MDEFVQIIKKGGVVAFPTETVYGLGADASNPSAVSKIFELKGRPSDNPLIVHISDINQIEEFAQDIPEEAYSLANKFWPGPLTLVLKKKPSVLDIVTAGLNTVALRMPEHPKALQFLKLTGPLVAPSANKSGKPSPTKADHVYEDFGDNFPVIDGGNCKIGLESTVLDLSNDYPTILRPGYIGKQELENLLKHSVSELNKSEHKPRSPGQKYSHYKPDAEVVYGPVSSFSNDTLYLLFDKKTKSPDSSNVINYGGDLKRLSRELYDQFRWADKNQFKKVHISPINDTGNQNESLVKALNNRIRKASD